MAQRAFILGGTGNVGFAIAKSLAVDSWDVTLAGKSERSAPDGFEYVALDRDHDGALSVANGFDLVIDVIPYEVAHAKQLLELDTGALIAISSASVYADDRGRTLDEAEGVDDYPELPVPIPETQKTVEPGDATYSTKKVALERILLDSGEVAAAIVRPCAIYGRGDRMGREWHFVKRAGDGRPHIILTNNGSGHFHTTASENIGELVRLLAAQPRTGVYNCGDPDPPTVLEIARAIAAAAGHSFDEVLLPEPAPRGELGQTPWSTPKPLLVDMAKAEAELGYRPAVSWADALPRQVEWLISATRDRDWREVLTRGANYLQFDYDAEDRFLAERGSSAPN
ncbi:MAG: NAD(P)-dependent oxidoreductase [Actinobacteria bacterium]|nr:NAD(P)-dependent oxidoreductase [Actinomycetota bacterium]